MPVLLRGEASAGWLPKTRREGRCQSTAHVTTRADSLPAAAWPCRQWPYSRSPVGMQSRNRTVNPR